MWKVCWGTRNYSNLSLLDCTLAGNDFNNDPIQVTFQPGESRHNICVVIIDDDIRERNEKFRLILSIPYSVRALGVWTGYPYYADVVITGMKHVLAKCYSNSNKYI